MAITAKQRAHYIHEIIKVLKSVKGMNHEESAEALFDNVIAVAIQDERNVWEKLLFVRENDRAH